jgi:uncharacterized protein YoxC
MNQIWAVLIAVALVAAAGFLIVLIMELRKTIRSLNEFLKTTGESLKSTLEELQQTLKSVRNVSNDLNEVTSDIKTLSCALRDVGMNIKHESDLVDGIISSTAIKTSGLKAGIKTGFMVLLNNLFLRKGGGK